MQRELSLFIHDGVSGVPAALITDDDVIVPGNEVDHPAFSFVAPVDPDDRSVSHGVFFPFPRFCQMPLAP